MIKITGPHILIHMSGKTNCNVVRDHPNHELTCVMGSPPHSVQQLLHTLEWDPDTITWSVERNATLWKSEHGKLGFRAKTYQGKEGSYTVILKVKEECNITAGHLKRFDRITSINNHPIIKDSEQYVLNILASLNNAQISVTLCRPVKFKVRNFNGRGESNSPRIETPSSRSNSDISCINLSDRSITFTSWNSTGAESLELNQVAAGFSDEQNNQLGETSFNAETRSKDWTKTSKSPSLNVRVRPKVVQKVSKSPSANVDSIQKACDNPIAVVEPLPNVILKASERPNIKAVRTISDSGSTLSNSDLTDYKFKRGISQVSGSDSNKSQSSATIDLRMRRREKSTKTKDHKTTKFVKTGSIENTDEEIEPLHPEESTTSPTVARLDKYSHFNVDDRSYSMPTTVSVADIVVEDPTLSLPLGLSNLGMNQNHSTTCQCSMCIPGSDQRVCSKCAVKTKPPSPNSTPPTDTQSIPLPEEHGHMILQNPQFAVWDGINTHVVEIDKGQTKGFGFSYKVMVSKNQDASVETYTLVDNVDKEGPSRDKLRIGDWVRSVNGTPIQLPLDAFTLLNNNGKEKTRRLVIQRPIRLSQSQHNLQVERDKTVHDLNPPSPQSPCGSGDQDPLIPGTIAPKKHPDKTVVPPNIYVIDSSHVDTCSKPVLPPFPKSVKLPKVRIFVCGSEAEKCVNSLLKESILELEAQNQCYSYVSCSMSTDCFGNILVSHPCSNLFSASTTSPRSSYVNQSEHRGGGDSKCKQCGGEVTSTTDGQAQGNIVNVELFAVPDDRFFHFCCRYLFTMSSIFILTFDGSKLLRSAGGEFSRLQNLSHTIRSTAGEDSHIMSCGFIDGGADTSNVMDEVRALFYTPLNSVLQNFHVFGPELVSINTSSSTAVSDSLDQNQLLQVLLKVVTETVQRQQVLQPSLLLIDQMVSLREKDFILTESQLMEIIQGRLPHYQVDVHQMILTYLIENREILLGKASSFVNPTFHRQIESLILVNPQSLLTCLQRIVTTVTEDKQNWLKMHSTGFIKASSFLELCGDGDKNKQFIADFMECNGIIVRKPNSPNSGTTEYFFPYFSITPSTADKTVIENRELELYLKFVDHESSQIYFALLFTIAGHIDVPSSFSVQDVQTCVFQHKGYHVIACHQKVHDRVHLIFKREDKAASVQPVELFSWLKNICHDVLDSLFVSFLLGAPCPRGENCSRTTPSSLHVIDLREKKPQYCDQERIDTMRPIRKWKQKDTQTQESVLSLATRSSKPTKQPVSVLDLPHSVVHNVCARLRIPSELGRDWKGLAGLMGYTHEEVRMMETVKDPVRELLYDWSTTNNGKIDDLIKLLEELHMENVLCYLRQALPQNNLNSLSSPQPPTQNSVVSFQTTSSSTNSEFSEHTGLTGQVLYQRSKVTETEVMPLYEESQGHTIRLNNLDGNNQMDTIGSSNQAITPVETVMDLNRILKS